MLPPRALLLSLIFLLTLLTGGATALQSFTTNCTLPDSAARFYYVSTPNVRGSLQIVWTSLSTLVLCTWSVLHLSVPKQRFGKHGLVDLIKHSRVWPSIFWSLVTIFAPEFTLINSAADYYACKKALESLTRVYQPCKESWTLTHVFFANMGGFVFKEEHQLGGPENGIHHLKLAEVVELYTNKESSWFQAEPPVAEEEIQDKSKSDSFAKVLALLQILYFFVQFFARIAESLPITQLELAVAATAAYSFVVYCYLYKKPKGAETAVILKEYLGPLPKELGSILRGREGTEKNQDTPSKWTGKVPSFSHFKVSDASFLVFCLLGVPLGAIHVAGWNLPFPSPTDTWLWRVSAVVSAAVGPAVLGVAATAALIYLLLGDGWPKLSSTVQSLGGLSMLTGLFVYIAVRLILAVEIVRCLFFLPPRAYLTPVWSASIPHVG